MKTCHTLIVSAEKRKRKKSGRATANGSERERAGICFPPLQM